jgi:hypothetical protein
MKWLWNHLKHLNWKYIIGEIVLLFVGINLAIGFNNWNSSSRLNQDRQLALQKIVEEIESNAEELQQAKAHNDRILRAFKAYNGVFAGHSTKVITTPDHMEMLQDSFPDFFRIQSTAPWKGDSLQYQGGTYINLELPELTDIAWATSQSIEITNTFSYDCLYQLASTYQLQDRLVREIDRAAQALQERRLTDLMRILEFTQQFEGQLQQDYATVLQTVKEYF